MEQLYANPDHLSRLESVAKKEGMEIFPVVGPHFLALLKCVSRFSSKYMTPLNMLELAAYTCINSPTRANLANFIFEAMTFARWIRELFFMQQLTVQHAHLTIKFLSATLDELLNHEQCLVGPFTDQFQLLGEKLKCFSNLIGTLPKDGISDWMAPVRTAGNILYFFFLTGNLKLSDLPQKMNFVLDRIRDYRRAKMSDSNSIFIAENLLDRLRNLMKHEKDAGMEDKMGILYMELVFWRPFLNEADGAKSGKTGIMAPNQKKILIQIGDLTEYIIGRFMIGEASLWFLSHVTKEIDAVALTCIHLRQPQSLVPDTVPNLQKVPETEGRLEVFPDLDLDGMNIETFPLRKRLISVVVRYIMKLCLEDHTPCDLLDSFWKCWKYVTDNRSEGYDDEYLNDRIQVQGLSGLIRLFVQKDLAQIFILQKLQSFNDGKNNGFLVSFLEFLSDILEEILHCITALVGPIKDQTTILYKELKCLITILGDAPLSHIEPEENKDLLTYIEGLANDIGSWLYFILSNDEVLATRISLALSLLLGKFKVLEEKIKDNCIKFSKLRVCNPPNTAPALFFIFDSLLHDLESPMTCKADLIVDVKDHLELFQEKLSFLRSILKDITVQQLEGLQELKELLTQIVEETYGAEYIINAFITGDAHVWYITLRLSQIVEKINLLEKEATKINLGDASRFKIVAEPGVVISGSDEHPVVVDHEIYVGLQEEEKKIAEVLVDGQRQLKIVSIIGMPGLGKTTLARRVFNAPSIVHRFDRRAWCVISQRYKRKRLLIDILSLVDSLDRDAMLEKDDDELAEQLYKCLKKRRYLIILDDVWDDKAWDDLRGFLPDDKNGSRILFTSRNKDVPLRASPESVIHELRFLTEVECWELLQQKVFQSECCPNELETVGKKLVHLCHGLPLAVVAIASVLSNDKTETFWQKVAENLTSYISVDPNKCMRILELSYEHLPVHLKPCFLHMGAFPEDMEIPVRKLISLWISEGFIWKDEKKSLEEVAENCLRDLIGRSLVLVSQRRSDGGIKTCNIHDLFRDLCLKRAEEGNFLKFIKGPGSTDEGDRNQFYSVVHHSKPLSLRLSSLLGYLPRLISKELKLRVLDSWAWSREAFDIEENILPVNLRYLGISYLHISVYGLENLEFLHVHGLDVLIDEPLLNMKKLRHLHIRNGAKYTGSCHRQAVEGKGFQNNNLQSLSTIHISCENDEKVLRCFPLLKRLKCKVSVLRNPSSTKYPRYPSLHFLSQLESLNITYYREAYTDYDVQSSYIRLDDMSFPSNLKKLTLHSFKLCDEELSIIGKLPKLEVLKLRWCYMRKGSLVWETNDDEFKRLKFLELNNFHVKQWNAESQHFPLIQQLVLWNCKYLMEIPSCFGDFPTLQMIKIGWCKKSVTDSALQILEVQKDMGNEDIKVIISSS